MRWYSYVGGAGALGLLVLRLVVGAAFILHGWSKIYRNEHVVLTEWMGPNSPFPPFLQATAAISEFGGGILWVLGLLTPLASIAVATTMAVALAKVHIPAGHPFVAPTGGPSYELAAAYLAVALTLLLAGPGVVSLDYLMFGRRRSNSALSPMH